MQQIKESTIRIFLTEKLLFKFHIKRC